jgi:hypothetical protein
MRVFVKLLFITLNTYLCITGLVKQCVLLSSEVQELETLEVAMRVLLLTTTTVALIETWIKHHHPICR